jgi:hypothetical protein
MLSFAYAIELHSVGKDLVNLFDLDLTNDRRCVDALKDLGLRRAVDSLELARSIDMSLSRPCIGQIGDLGSGTDQMHFLQLRDARQNLHSTQPTNVLASRVRRRPWPSPPLPVTQ